MAFIGNGVEHGLRCLLGLAGRCPGSVGRRDLAGLQGLSPSFVAKIFPELEKAGIVDASEGLRGGCRLASPAASGPPGWPPIDGGGTAPGPSRRPLPQQRSVPMKRWLLIGALVCIAGASAAQTTKVTPLLSRDLSGIAGKEGTMLTVEYPPGGSDPVHRHDAYVFVYVLEGSVVMQVKGAAPVTLHPGQTFYEGPDDIHLVGRNASRTEPAKFLAFFVKNKGAPVVMPVQ